MANQYATAAELVARSASLGTISTTELDAALDAASRGIDGYCNRRFWLDSTATVRVFAACDWYELDLGAHEIGAASPVTVKTDDGTGAFATTISTSDYMLEPVNAPHEPTGAAPYTTIRRLAGSWPRTYTSNGRQDLVQVTAKYGWPAVPSPIREACLVLALAQFENPGGVRSESIDGYSVSYSRDVGLEIEENPKLRTKLNPYRRGWAA